MMANSVNYMELLELLWHGIEEGVREQQMLGGKFIMWCRAPGRTQRTFIFFTKVRKALVRGTGVSSVD